MSKLFMITISALLLWGCTSYHCDRDRNGKFSHIAVGVIENKTKEGDLGALLKRQLQEQLGTAPGFSKNKSTSWLTLNATILSLKQESKASAELRNKYAREDQRHAYQNVLHKITIRVYYQVVDWTQDGKILRRQLVTATADVPDMNDMNMSLKQAYLQATNDAALRILDDLVDGNLESR